MLPYHPLRILTFLSSIAFVARAEPLLRWGEGGGHGRRRRGGGMTSVSLAAVIGGAEISGVTRAAIALVLVVAALLKLVRPGGAVSGLIGLGLPRGAARSLVAAMTVGELAVATLLITGSGYLGAAPAGAQLSASAATSSSWRAGLHCRRLLSRLPQPESIRGSSRIFFSRLLVPAAVASSSHADLPSLLRNRARSPRHSRAGGPCLAPRSPKVNEAVIAHFGSAIDFSGYLFWWSILIFALLRRWAPPLAKSGVDCPRWPAHRRGCSLRLPSGRTAGKPLRRLLRRSASPSSPPFPIAPSARKRCRSPRSIMPTRSARRGHSLRRRKSASTRKSPTISMLH